MTSEIIYLKTVGSTMDEVVSRYKDGVKPPIIVAAERQTSGRGQRSHTWESTGGGLYFSILMLPTVFEFDQVPELTQKVGYLVQQQIRNQTGLASELKLPNDILIKGKKVAGILMESSCPSGSTRPEYVTIGVGLNVNQIGFSPELETIATSLCIETGKQYPMEPFIEGLSRALTDII